MKYLELKQINAPYEVEMRQAVSEVIDGGWYLQGRAVAAFEKSYADYIGTRFCVSCANGLDALTLILRAYLEMDSYNGATRCWFLPILILLPFWPSPNVA